MIIPAIGFQSSFLNAKTFTDNFIEADTVVRQ